MKNSLVGIIALGILLIVMCAGCFVKSSETKNPEEYEANFTMTVLDYKGNFEIGFRPEAASDKDLINKLSFVEAWPDEEGSRFDYKFVASEPIGDTLYVTRPVLFINDDALPPICGPIDQDTVFYTEEGEPWFRITSVDMANPAGDCYYIHIMIEPYRNELPEPCVIVDDKAPQSGTYSMNFDEHTKFNWGEFYYTVYVDGARSKEEILERSRLVLTDSMVRIDEPRVVFESDDFNIVVVDR